MKSLKLYNSHLLFIKNSLGGTLHENVGVNQKGKRWCLGIRKFNTREKGIPKIKAEGGLKQNSFHIPA